MEPSLVSIHNPALILIFLECGLFALLIITRRVFKRPGYLLLAILFTLNAMIALHTVTIWEQISSAMGVWGNYLTLIIVNALIVYSFSSMKTVQIGEPDNSQQPEAEDEISRVVIKPESIDRVRHAMEVEKLFLNSRLTLEDFSQRIQIPSRHVSMIINRHLNQNFHEFVNKHRIVEAQQILCSLDAEQKNVLDVATAVGFNSKQAFNRFFKKFTGMTPSEFRDKNITQQSSGSD